MVEDWSGGGLEWRRTGVAEDWVGGGLEWRRTGVAENCTEFYKVHLRPLLLLNTTHIGQKPCVVAVVDLYLCRISPCRISPCRISTATASLNDLVTIAQEDQLQDPLDLTVPQERELHNACHWFSL